MASLPPTQNSSIICADAFQWLHDQPDESIDNFVVDPPYGIGLAYDGWTEHSTPEEHAKFIVPFWELMKRKLKPNGVICMWQGFTYLRYYWDWFLDFNLIVNTFRKHGVGLWEPIVFWTKGGNKQYYGNDFIDAEESHRIVCNRLGDINEPEYVQSPNGQANKKLTGNHPCPKNLDTCCELIRRKCKPGTLIVDLFCGSGSIPLAASLLGHPYVGIDQSELYCENTKKRIENHLSR